MNVRNTVFKLEDNKLLFDTNKDDKFIIKNPHSISYEDHTYVLDNAIKKDYNELNKTEIKKKLSNYKYLKKFIRYFLDMHEDIGTSYTRLLESFIGEYGIVEINYSIIPEDECILLINNFKKRNKNNNKKNISINDVVNIKNLAIGAINNKKYKNNIHTNFNESILSFKLKEESIVTKLSVTFERKNIINNKIIYCIMTKDMEDNIKSIHNTQYFVDVTYYCIPPNNKKYRLFVLLAFNKEKYHSTICNLSMISNENIETFYTIFDFLKNKYDFKPKNVTIDFSSAEYNAIKKIYKDITVFDGVIAPPQNTID